MITVQSVATATEIVIISVWSEHVINIIVQSLKTDGFALFVALCGMVEYNMQEVGICLKKSETSGRLMEY